MQFLMDIVVRETSVRSVGAGGLFHMTGIGLDSGISQNNLITQETDRAHASFIIITRVKELLAREWVGGPSSSYLLGS